MIVTLTPDTSASPAMEIVVDQVPNGTTSITVQRSGAGQVTVRGAQKAVASPPTWFTTDWEAPLGAPLTYTAYAYNAFGALLSSAQATATVQSASAWLSDPLAPAVAHRVRYWGEGAFGGMLGRDGATVPVSGSRLPIAVTDVRRSATGIPLPVICPSSEALDELLSVLDADPMLLRLPAAWGLRHIPAAAYVTAPEAGLTPVPVRGVDGAERADWWLVDMAADVVAPPVASIVVPPRTYADRLREAPTYQAALLKWPTYLDAARA